MRYLVAYHGRSGLQGRKGAQSLAFAANLNRDPVAFDAPLNHPLRFREAISALHDVVISDLRFQPRDKAAYEEWKRSEQQREASLRREEFSRVKQDILSRQKDVPPDLEAEYRGCLRQYWNARQKYANYLVKHDPALWRMLMPCDPVVTVGEDVVFFECFSADESSYGCLTVERESGFGRSSPLQPGTTNVDYSWDLYDHFQTLRSYRETRLSVDPGGVEVATEDDADYREEKIDLPEGWLRGFMQIQVAMGLPMRRVSLSRGAVYSLLAWYRRHKPSKSPRALRFELVVDRPPELVLEPWERRVVSRETRYTGPTGPPIRIWGTRRLLMLARALPLAERFDVYLLGTGMPSFWVARMGEMRLTLGLSGWTANNWTRGSALDTLRPPREPPDRFIGQVADLVRTRRAMTLAEIQSQLTVDAGTCLAALMRLAHSGQVIFDLDASLYRWRQVMPMALGAAQLGPENEELVASREIVAAGSAAVESQREAPEGGMVVVGKAQGKPAEVLVDADGMIRQGRCVCGHHRRGGIRMGPCRHLLALRELARRQGPAEESNTRLWYDRLQRWASSGV